MSTVEKIYYIIYAAVIVIGLAMAIYNLYLIRKQDRELDEWVKEMQESSKEKEKKSGGI